MLLAAALAGASEPPAEDCDFRLECRHGGHAFPVVFGRWQDSHPLDELTRSPPG